MWKRAVEVFIKLKCLLLTAVEKKVMVDAGEKKTFLRVNQAEACTTQIVLFFFMTMFYPLQIDSFYAAS